jgi:hypothetical protein
MVGVNFTNELNADIIQRNFEREQVIMKEKGVRRCRTVPPNVKMRVGVQRNKEVVSFDEYREPTEEELALGFPNKEVNIGGLHDVWLQRARDEGAVVQENPYFPEDVLGDEEQFINT